MKRLALLLTLACMLPAAARAQGNTEMCVQESGNVICRVQMLNFPRTGDPVFIVSVNLVRSVPTSRVSARVFATDCGTMREQRNFMTLGVSAGGVLAQFNWPVALQQRPRRCVEIEMAECRSVTDQPVYCAAVINQMQSRGSVQW
jgi:hypothetical protein